LCLHDIHNSLDTIELPLYVDLTKGSTPFAQQLGKP
jgi:hypothetical protein